ncbi:MAG TPA: lipopolysaccharide heptosyltransferase II [Chthoniobacteraceae bacterium]
MDRLGFALFRLVGALLRRLPLLLVFRCGTALGTAAYYLAPPYRKLVLRNLQIAFGAEKSAHELRLLAREHFAALGANLFSSLKIPHLPPETIRELVEVEGLEHIIAGKEAGQGFTMVIGHIGNWELFAQISAIVFPCPVGTIYQALGNPHIDAEVRRSRAVLGLQLFERKEGFGKASQFIRAGGAVGILVDQHAGDAGLWSPFFGRLASTTTLAATLAQRTGSSLVPAVVHTIGEARWRFSILPQLEVIDRSVESITADMNVAVEELIRTRPADWFWVHNRWKTPKPKFLLATYKRGVYAGSNLIGDRLLVNGPATNLANAHTAPTNHQSPITNHAASPLQPFRMMIRASNWLGDAVMSVPAVRAIKRGRPDAHVAILTPAKLADFWRTVAEVDEVITIQPGENVFAVAKRLRGMNFEAAILFPNSLRVALEAWLAHIPRRVGYPGHRRAWLLNQIFRPKKKKRPEPPPHQVHHYLELANFVGADITAPDLFRTNHRSSITHHAAPVLALCPGAEYGPAKRWLPERFAEVMRSVHESTRCEWKLVGVAKDRPVADAITAAIPAVPVTDLIGKTTLAGLIDELRSCDALLTNDTGTMHLAAYLGVPTVALFGSTEPALTGPLGGGHQVIRHHVPCSPCFLRECPIDFRCMRAIEVEEVISAVQQVLARRALLPT